MTDTTELEYQTERLRLAIERAETAEAQRDALEAEAERLRQAFRVNMIRFVPHITHEDIDYLLQLAALQKDYTND